MPRAHPERGWLRNRELADFLGISTMTLWRWQKDEALNFPQPSAVHGARYTSVEAVEAWLKSRVVQRTGGEGA
jgi:predicted DNA-binding transcriptional regulator AlpA